MDLDTLKVLSGIQYANSPRACEYSNSNNSGSNISLTGSEKRALERKHNIQPGTDAWFQLWFSRPYLTNEKPIG
jgi:hypothetical protein